MILDQAWFGFAYAGTSLLVAGTVFAIEDDDDVANRFMSGIFAGAVWPVGLGVLAVVGVVYAFSLPARGVMWLMSRAADDDDDGVELPKATVIRD